MNVLIILASPKQHSFNHALAQTIATALSRRGDDVSLRDLHAEGFDPVITEEEIARGGKVPDTIRAHADAVLAADVIVVVHPNYWGQPPAILKGWIDRVLRPGEAYRFGTNEQGEGIVIGQLQARAALVITTSNTPRQAELDLYGDPLDNLWKRCVFGFCGVQHVVRRNFESVIVSTQEQRERWLAEAESLALDVIR